MIIEPKFRGFLCTASHPEGCSLNVDRQIELVESKVGFDGPKNVLIIGASTGYGLATRISTTFGAKASTIGVFFEKPAAGKRTASAGWYNTVAFEKRAHDKGFYAKSINGDAFSNEIKEKTTELIREDLGRIDLIVYSLAAPRRKDPDTGEVYSSVIKPIGSTYKSKTVDPLSGIVKEISIDPANDYEVEQTIRVMGGDDWLLWIDWLLQQGLLSDDVLTVAYSYIGPELTHPIYKNGTIGRAKDHLFKAAKKLTEKLALTGGNAFISINKALVTQASAAIPVVSLYMSILFKLMKEKGVDEGCIEQIERLLRDNIYSEHINLDKEGRIRVDNFEMDSAIQSYIRKIWDEVNTDNLNQLTDIDGYRDDFYQLFGFGLDGVDYTKDVEVNLSIPSIFKSDS